MDSPAAELQPSTVTGTVAGTVAGAVTSTALQAGAVVLLLPQPKATMRRHDHATTGGGASAAEMVDVDAMGGHELPGDVLMSEAGEVPSVRGASDEPLALSCLLDESGLLVLADDDILQRHAELFRMAQEQ